MRKMVIFIIAVLILTAWGTVSFAGSINWRQVRQQKRIHTGVKSGQLTVREAARLEREQARIECMERTFRSDGHFTPRERIRTQRMLNRSSRHIYRAKHNNRSR